MRTRTRSVPWSAIFPIRYSSRAASIAAFAAILTMAFVACAGGLTGSKEEKHAYFENLEKDTLTRLVREYPKTETELAQSVGYAVIEKKVVKVPLVGGGGGAAVVVEKAPQKRSYLRVPEIQFGMGLGGRAEKIVLIFQDVDQLRDLADGLWHGSMGAEASAKAGDVGAAGGAGTGDIGKKGHSTYVLTDSGVSATATIGLIRAQPYSID